LIVFCIILGEVIVIYLLEHRQNSFEHQWPELNEQCTNPMHDYSVQTQCTNTDTLQVTVEAAADLAKQTPVERQSGTEWSIVTGAAGFIGSHVAAHCLSIGQSVVLIDDLSGGFTENLPLNTGYGDRAVFESGSITDEVFIDRVFRQYGSGENRIRFIYHLAAYAAEGLSHFIRRYNYDNNLLGTAALINKAVNYDVKCFVFTSSIAIYGSGPHEGFSGKFTENTAASPEDPYGISKYAVELDLKAAHEMFGLNYIIFRPHNVYGPNQNTFDKYRNVIGIFLYNLLHNKPMGIFGDGAQTRSFSFIDDVAPYIAASPYFEHLRNRQFNIGSERAYSLTDLARTIIESVVYDNAKIFDLHKHSPLDIVTQFEAISGSARKDKADVIGELMENEDILRELEARKEVVNAEASHKYFNCMFGIEEDGVVQLREGLRLTLDWILTNHYEVDANGKWTESTSFHPVNFHSVEIAKNLPKSWAADARSSAGDGQIRITPKALIHSDRSSKEQLHRARGKHKKKSTADPQIMANSIHDEDPDALIDPKKGKAIAVPNWGKTYGPLRVWCFIVALYDEEELLVIQETWGRHCDKILFAVDEKEGQNILENEAKDSALEEIIPIHTRVADEGAKRKDLWEKIWKFFVELEDRYHGQYDFILRADTDTWFSVENFREYAQYYNPRFAWNMGYVLYHEYDTIYNAGGNYALSRGAIEKLVVLFQSEEFEGRSINGSLGTKDKWTGSCSKKQVGWFEDVFLGQCLGALGVWPLHTRNENNQERWHWWTSHQKDTFLPHQDIIAGKDLIASHNYKNKATRRSDYVNLEQQYHAEKKKAIPVPEEPHSFHFDGSLFRLRNIDLIYNLN